MNRKEVALGKCNPKGACLALSSSRLSDKERIALLEQQLTHMQKTMAEILKRMKEDESNAYEGEDLNRHSLPVGMVCYGVTEKSVWPVVLTVKEDGYQVGTTLHNSLSAAAEAVSGVRRSGWTFWRTADGKTLKEVFK